MEKDPQLKGQVDLLVLAVVSRGPTHGYALVERLRRESGEVFQLPEGTVYPALYRLEALGLLRSDATIVSGRARRIYRLTTAGRRALHNRETAWRELSRGVESVLRGGPLSDHV
jgi:PadR family transcriptional regulator, regulatory protein PadR